MDLKRLDMLDGRGGLTKVRHRRVNRSRPRSSTSI